MTNDFMNLEDDDIKIIEDSDKCWNVLIVDDDQDVHTATKFACHSMKPHGFPIKFWDAYSAEQAYEFITTQPPIDLVLLDVIMETPNAGLDLADIIRDELNMRHIPVIIIRSGQTGTSNCSDVRNNANIDVYLPKSKASSAALFELFEKYLNEESISST